MRSQDEKHDTDYGRGAKDPADAKQRHRSGGLVLVFAVLSPLPENWGHALSVSGRVEQGRGADRSALQRWSADKESRAIWRLTGDCMSETRTARARRRCARCGDPIEKRTGAPLCGGCLYWSRRMVEKLEVKSSDMEIKLAKPPGHHSGRLRSSFARIRSNAGDSLDTTQDANTA